VKELFDAWLATHFPDRREKAGLDGEHPALSTAHFRRPHDRRGQLALFDAA